MNHFDRGWRDRLLDLPPQTTTHKVILTQLAYERGRHLASLWLWELGNLREKQGKNRTIHTAAVERRWAFDEAYKLMSVNLRAVVNAEERFVSLRGMQ